MAVITSLDFPGDRLIVCRNPDLAAERARKCEDLRMATERDLARIQTAVARRGNPLRGTEKTALAVDSVIDRHRMCKHFDPDIAAASFRFTRKADAIAAAAASDGLYVIRTILARDALGDAETVRSYKSLALVKRAFPCIKTVDLRVRPVHHWLAEPVRAHAQRSPTTVAR